MDSSRKSHKILAKLDELIAPKRIKGDPRGTRR